MTQIGLKLLEDRAYILTDTLCASFSGKTGFHYKPKIFDDKKVVVVGRGKVPVHQKIHELIGKSGAKNFDELVSLLPDFTRDAIFEFFEGMIARVGGAIPPGWDISDAMEDYHAHLKDKGADLNGQGFDADIFCIGYSKKRECMGLAMVKAYRPFRNFKLEELYYSDKPGFFFFRSKEPVIEYCRRIGRYPESQDELAACLKLVFRADMDDARRKGEKAEIYGGGDIDLTTIYADGSTEIRKIGKMDEPVWPEAKTRKIGRNDPCPCGSGKKHKNCCRTA